MSHKTYIVKITTQAREQLQEIIQYIASGLKNPDAALRLLDEIEKETSSLSQLPHRITLVQEEPWRNHGIRKILVNNFYIYFWIDDDNGIVQVIAVIYGKRDQIRRLSNMDIK